MMGNTKFEGNEFALQVITKGSFVDNSIGAGSFLVEVTTVRLNPVALKAWILSDMMDERDCFEDGPKGDAQWEAHKAKYAKRRRAWEAQMVESLGIDPSAGSVSITQAQSEIFTVVYIREIA